MSYKSLLYEMKAMKIKITNLWFLFNFKSEILEEIQVMSAASRELQNVIFHQFTLSEDGNSNSGQCSSQLLSGSEFIIELKFFIQ